MTRFAPLTAALAALLALAACSAGGTTPSTEVAGSSVTSTVTPASASASPSASPSPTATPAGGEASGSPAEVSINPCTLLTDAQAGDVNSVTYGPGVEHPMGTGSLECVWQNTSVHASIVVQVAKWPSASEAEVAYTEALAAAKGFAITDVAGFADKTVIARAPSSVPTGGIYVREGDIFFDVVYVAGTTPSDAKLKFAATLILGNLP
jgi:hypothetical protein